MSSNRKPWSYSLEYYVSTGCCNSCVGCSHGAPLHNDVIDVETFRRDVEMMKDSMDVHRFALSGGEPLLNPHLVDLIKIARQSGIAPEVMVLTNGQLLDKMPEEFWSSLDVLRISIYPGQITDEQLQRWEEHAKMYSAEFMTIKVGAFYLPITKRLRNPRTTWKTFKRCPYFRACSAIFQGRYYPCSQAFFLPEIMEIDPYVDSLPIEGLTAEKLGEFLSRRRPLESCKRCSYKYEIPWRQTTRDRWIEESSIG